ncbi:MAG TPA: hypothetical protein VFX60_00165 [Micromonospora sp.]|nr:hypothetical protein [Micromonospora sp.]
MTPPTSPGSWLPPKSAFAGFRFPPEGIMLAVRWYLRFNLSYRDVALTSMGRSSTYSSRPAATPVRLGGSSGERYRR